MKLGCKAACMTAGVSSTAVDGMSAALGINFLAGQKVRHCQSMAFHVQGVGRGFSTDFKDFSPGTQFLRMVFLVQVKTFLTNATYFG